MSRRSHRNGLLATALFVGMGLALGPAWSDGNPSPPPPQDPAKPKADPEKPKATDTKGAKKKKKQTEQRFQDSYRTAYDLVQAKRFEDAIVAFRAIGEDDHPDVANYIGYSQRQLGRFAEAKEWYDRALAADPNHARTWQYYGMWHLEQGNRLKAEDHLAKIKSICGTACREYALMQDALNGNIVY